MAVRNINQLRRYIAATRSQVGKAHSLALIQVTQNAERLAKRNVTTNFFGRMGRTLSGRMLNSVFSGFFIRQGLALPTGFVGVKGIPYGAIHEFGGTIEPKKARHLWVKVNYKGRFKRLTPSEFFELRAKERARARSENPRAKKRKFEIITSKKGNLVAVQIDEFKTRDDKITPIFVLKDKVEIPERAYIRPAIAESLKDWPRFMAHALRKSLREKFFTGPEEK